MDGREVVEGGITAVLTLLWGVLGGRLCVCVWGGGVCGGACVCICVCVSVGMCVCVLC